MIHIKVGDRVRARKSSNVVLLHDEGIVSRIEGLSFLVRWELSVIGTDPYWWCLLDQIELVEEQ